MDWKKWFQPHILDRGFIYYQNGLVEDYEMDCDYVQAVVQGSDAYDVYIDIVNGNIYDMECDCPYAQDDNYCKHMAAVLFYMEAETEGIPKKKQDTVSQKSTIENSVRDLVEKAEEKVVKEFLTDILENDEKLYSRFKRIVFPAKFSDMYPPAYRFPRLNRLYPDFLPLEKYN